MAMYFLLGTLTNEGQRLLHHNPDLVVQTVHEATAEGAEILGQYPVLGRYDFVIIVRADDNDAVARMSLQIGMRTGLHIETLASIGVGFLSDRAPFAPGGLDDAVKMPLESETSC